MPEVAKVYQKLPKENIPITTKRRKKGHLRLVKSAEVTKDREDASQLNWEVEISLKKDAQKWLRKKQQKIQEDRDFINQYGLNEWVVWRFKQDWAEYLSQLPKEKQKSLSKGEAQKVIDIWVAQMKK